MATSGPGIFDNDAARTFLNDLRSAPPSAVGDLISAALIRVAHAEHPVLAADGQVALVAVALLLSDYDVRSLDGAPDADAVAAWFADLEVELNPARRQIVDATLRRILLPQENEWFELWTESGSRAAAVGAVRLLRDLLADSATDE